MNNKCYGVAYQDGTFPYTMAMLFIVCTICILFKQYQQSASLAYRSRIYQTPRCQRERSWLGYAHRIAKMTSLNSLAFGLPSITLSNLKNLRQAHVYETRS